MSDETDKPASLDDALRPQPEREITPEERKALREARFTTQASMAILREVNGQGGADEAIEYLRAVASGRVKVAERTRVQAATALLRHGIELHAPTSPRGPIVELNVGRVPGNSKLTMEDIHEALKILTETDPKGPAT